MSYIYFTNINETKNFGYKPTPIIFSDNDVYINYDKWESGEIKSLIVIALSGSGKSTLSKQLADKYNGYYISIDVLSFKISSLHPNRANFEYIKENDKYLYKYLKEKDLPPTLISKYKDPYDKNKCKEIDPYIKWLCFERNDLDTNRVVIDGADAAVSIANVKELTKVPIIIKGTSLLTAMLRRMGRIANEDNYLKAIQIAFKNFYSQYNKMYKELDRARKASMEQEYDEREENKI